MDVRVIICIVGGSIWKGISQIWDNVDAITSIQETNYAAIVVLIGKC